MPDQLVLVEQIQILAEQAESSVLHEVTESVLILTDAEQGPSGPPGPPGAILHTLTAATALGGHRAVLVGLTGAIYADNQIEAHAGRVSGVTVAAASSGAQVSFQSSGRLTEPSWSWAPDGDIWLGASGQLTQTYPSGAVFAQRLGYAISATEMWIDLVEPTIH